jgi:hypothetical protein
MSTSNSVHLEKCTCTAINILPKEEDKKVTSNYSDNTTKKVQEAFKPIQNTVSSVEKPIEQKTNEIIPEPSTSNKEVSYEYSSSSLLSQYDDNFRPDDLQGSQWLDYMWWYNEVRPGGVNTGKSPNSRNTAYFYY